MRRSHHMDYAIAGGEVDLVINTPTGSGARSDGWEIRRAAVSRGIPCITTLSGGQAAARAIRAARAGEPLLPDTGRPGAPFFANVLDPISRFWIESWALIGALICIAVIILIMINR